jgi:uncharacterized protein YeaO (DUF488 family)
MDWEFEYQQIKLLLDSERAARRRIQEMYDKADHDRKRYKEFIEELQDEIEERKQTDGKIEAMKENEDT